MSTKKDTNVAVFSKRLKNSIPKGLTQQGFADAVGVSLPAVKKWISGKAYPTFEYLVPISEVIGKSLDFLLKGVDTQELNIINVYDVQFSAGGGSFVSQENICSCLNFGNDFFNKYNISKKNAVGIFIKGDSMQPKLYSGDIAIIDVSDQLFNKDGIYAFRYQCNCFIKQLQKAGNDIIVNSINKEYSQWKVESKADFTIIGKVKAVISKP